MSSREQTCYTCWSTFYTTGFAVTKCPTCQQTEQLKKVYERSIAAQEAAAATSRTPAYVNTYHYEPDPEFLKEIAEQMARAQRYQQFRTERTWANGLLIPHLWALSCNRTFKIANFAVPWICGLLAAISLFKFSIIGMVFWIIVSVASHYIIEALHFAWYNRNILNIMTYVYAKYFI